jgi:centriolin
MGGVGRIHVSLSQTCHLPFQVTSQQQELAVLDSELGHRREELLLLQDSLAQAKADLQEALTLGETEVAEKCSHIRVWLL